MFYVVLTSLSMTAFAADSTPTEPTIQEDGTVTSTVMVPGDPAAVRAYIADPVKAAGLCPDIVSARVVQHGTCDLVEVNTRGMTSDLQYLVKRCPTANGWQETMVSSDDFDDVKVSWNVTASGADTKVVYTIRTAPDLPVPQRMVSAMTARSAVTALKNLVHRVTGQ